MASPARKRTNWLQLGSGKSYAHRVHRPLQCLIFISPLLLFYQIASTVHPWSPEEGSSPQVVAFILMLKFFAFFGAAGNVLPLAAVIAILLFWHLARKDPWEFDPGLYTGMAGESILWGIPFFVIGLAVSARHGIPPGSAPTMASGMRGVETLPWQTEVVLSVGAGVYEELIFRLIAITALNMILVDIFEIKVQYAIPIIILASAMLFSAYHYLGTESFSAGTFFFRATMGIYLAGISIYRGYGITVESTHRLRPHRCSVYVHTHH